MPEDNTKYLPKRVSFETINQSETPRSTIPVNNIVTADELKAATEQPKTDKDEISNTMFVFLLVLMIFIPITLFFLGMF